MPVTATRFVPQGLDSQNQALPGAQTTIQIQVIEPRADGYVSPPRYAVRSVKVQVSYNGGKTWQAVKVTGHGTSWQATVTDPSGGYIALRSTVTDSAGDSTTETIYRAYAVS